MFYDEIVHSSKRWLKVQSIVTGFWNPRRKGYLFNIQSRQQWQTPQRNVKIGDIVSIKDEDIPRSIWKSRKVDLRNIGLVIGDRSPDLKTLTTTTLQCPIHKLEVQAKLRDVSWTYPF
jgi:hypothetical protein